MAIINSAELTVTQSTAVKNTASLGFIHNVNSNLNSYNNYFFNNLTGPWLTDSGPNPNSNYECQLVDENNNTLDVTTYTYTSSLFNNDTFYFVDESNRDFHLKENSTLIDYTLPCPVNPNLDESLKDVDGEPRTSLADLGADENLSNDIIFQSGFEGLLR